MQSPKSAYSPQNTLGESDFKNSARIVRGSVQQGNRISAFSHCITSHEITPNLEKVLHCRHFLEQSAVLSALFGRQVQTVQRF